MYSLENEPEGFGESIAPRFGSRAALERLNTILHLPFTQGMQDWDVELADASRLGEFCALYETGRLDIEERFALMRLIVASLDDLLSVGDPGGALELVTRVIRVLRKDCALHFHTVEYWCLLEEDDPKNVFAVTPLLRQVWRECFEPEYARGIER
ncbi:MAG: hypothetical protein H7145_24660 [Akkermansiaceae bacterium]|nr:hypothetical protein [Armatimonadota bacterium]